jgi:hypothetical protein
MDSLSFNGAGSGAGGKTTSSSATNDDDNRRPGERSQALAGEEAPARFVDVIRASSLECGHRLQDHDDVSGGGDAGSDGYNTTTEEASSSASPKVTPPNDATNSKRSHAVVDKNQEYITTPARKPARRFCQKPGKIDKEWEKPVGRYSVNSSTATSERHNFQKLFP